MIFLFSPWGDPVQNRPQNPAPAGCLFSTRKSRLEVPGGQGKKRKKGCTKKVGNRFAKKNQALKVRPLFAGIGLNLAIRKCPRFGHSARPLTCAILLQKFIFFYASSSPLFNTCGPYAHWKSEHLLPNCERCAPTNVLRKLLKQARY